MKILHTADWHLCSKEGRIDRTDDLKNRVERVAELCEEHAVDLLLIAGDLFSDNATVDQMTEAFTHLRKTFTRFFERGGTILAITGNHDRDGKINMIRAGMSLASPLAGQKGDVEKGRMYLVNGRYVARLTGAGGQRVQFVLVPYPFPSRYELVRKGFTSLEEQNQQLHGAVADWIREVSDREDFDHSVPTVLAAHIHVKGSEVHTTYKMTEREDVLFQLADLNPGWAYVALGHIHKPQALGGQLNVRYPGSLDRLDFGETHDEHGVLLVEIGKSGLVCDPIRLPIPATPFHTIELNDPASELPLLADRYPNRESAIVRVRINGLVEGISRDETAREVRRLFPRLHEIKWQGQDAPDESDAHTSINPLAGFETNVRDWLTASLKDDLDKENLFALAETFMAKGRAA